MSASNRVSTRLTTLLDGILGGMTRDFAVRLPDGTVLPSDDGEPERFVLQIRSPEALRRLVLDRSELSLGESFVCGELDVEGPLEAVFPLADHLLGEPRSFSQRLRLALSALRLARGEARENGRGQARLGGRRHSRGRDRAAVSYHYDLPAGFYSAFLDPLLVYSCAYFSEPGEPLDAAQERKLDYVCRKLRLRQGERLLDIGCGFGALALHAAERYGVTVLGITLSKSQAEVGAKRVTESGLTDHCRVELRDYRDLEEREAFDKIVSVGMFEHVGPELLPEYFRHVWRLLRPGGVFLNHGIATTATAKPPPGPTFWERYVFPDGGLVTIDSALGAAEAAGFEVRDVESLREHYALTLRSWAERLEESREEACAAAGPECYRVWRLYMSAAAYRLTLGRLNVYQTLLAKTDRGNSGLPLTRDDWYVDQSASSTQ